MHGAPLHSVDQYFILREVNSHGSVIGYFNNVPICARVSDRWNRQYSYAGITAPNTTGGYDRKQLRPCEFILKPGIIYRMHQQSSQKLLAADFASALKSLPLRSGRGSSSKMRHLQTRDLVRDRKHDRNFNRLWRVFARLLNSLRY
jgi:hypothetical protein